MTGRITVLWHDKVVAGTVRGHLVGYNVIDGQAGPVVQLNGVVTGLAGSDTILHVGTQEGTLHAVRP